MLVGDVGGGAVRERSLAHAGYVHGAPSVAATPTRLHLHAYTVGMAYLHIACECGHRWRSQAATGRTQCPQCRARIYVTAAQRRSAHLGLSRIEASTTARAPRAPRQVAPPPPDRAHAPVTPPVRIAAHAPVSAPARIAAHAPVSEPVSGGGGLDLFTVAARAAGALANARAARQVAPAPAPRPPVQARRTPAPAPQPAGRRVCPRRCGLTPPCTLPGCR